MPRIARALNFILLLMSALSAQDPAKQRSDLTAIPLYFEENKGQTDAQVRYIARSTNVVGFVLQDGWTLSLGGHAVSMHIAGADSKAAFIPEGPVEGITNYYSGSRAVTNIPHYFSVRGKNIRPGIDVVYHGNKRELEYDLVIRPGADVDALRLRFEGSRPALADNGDIVLKTGQGEVRQHRPRVWQEANGERTEVHCRYSLLESVESGEVGFVFSNYDRSAELVVDPVISYSTYLGGSWDRLAGIAVDRGGNAYLTGSTHSWDFPGTFQGNVGNGDVFVAKLNPDGTGFVYFTFIGGTSADVPSAIAIDRAGNAYVTGQTSSPDFPVTVNHFAAGQHAFVLKLGSTGNIVYSTALVGNGEDNGIAIAADSFGSAYVAGSTTSTNFPVNLGSYQITPGGGGEAFAAKLSSTGLIVYATYLGGSKDDVANAIAVDALGNAFVGGNTASPNFPATPGAFSTAFSGGRADAFVVKLSPGGSALSYATYLGGSDDDDLRGLALDAAGNCYVTGGTWSNGFPTTPGAFSRSKYLSAGFVSKLSPTGTSLVYSTFLGGNLVDSATAIAVDSTGSAYVVGNTTSVGFPIIGGAFKHELDPTNYYAAGDMFLTKVDPGGASLSYSTFLGSSSYGDSARAVALDGIGGVYLAGFTEGTTYPSTAGAFNTAASDARGAMVVTKIDFNSPTSCHTILSPQKQSVPVYGGEFSVNITLPPGCPWQAVFRGTMSYTSKVPDFGVASTSPISFTGTVGAGSITEYGTFYINLTLFSLTRSAGSCQEPFITPQDFLFNTASQFRELSLVLPASCPWTAVSGAPWLVVSQNPTGVGPAKLVISVAANNASTRSTTLTIAGKSITVTQEGVPPALFVNRAVLTFTANSNGPATSPQTVTVSTNVANVMWTAVSDQANIVVTPSSGTGNGSFQVSANPGPGGTVRVSSPGAAISPKVILVNIYKPSSNNLFGSFDTPAANSVVAGAIPVTGWALDNVEVAKVDIWRESGSALVYVGDAAFVEGARPGIETQFDSFPFSYRAGWGCQILTNLLPQGNGTFKLHAIAHNKAGLSFDLGTKTIVVDNAHAAKPFGAIDTPAQGGDASGHAFVNSGWALTRNPNQIPIDGSTISVVIDGQPVGHPTYNQFRSDIASLFPGLMNSGGAGGFFTIDTTMLTNGVHTISWNVFDNAGHSDGIGSRYFNVFNSGNNVAEPEEARNRAATVRERFPGILEIEELGQVELPLSAVRGYQLVNGERRPLPIGSSMKHGVFYWQPGPGFLGDFNLVFERQDAADAHVRIKIRPRTYP